MRSAATRASINAGIGRLAGVMAGASRQMNAKLQAQAIALGAEVKYLDPAEARKTEGFGGCERAWD